MWHITVKFAPVLLSSDDLLSSSISQTSKNFLLFFHLAVDNRKTSVYQQVDSAQAALRRESAELFMKEPIPPLVFAKVRLALLALELTGLSPVK